MKTIIPPKNPSNEKPIATIMKNKPNTRNLNPAL